MNLEKEAAELMEIAKAIGYGKIPPYQHNECYTSGAFDLIIFNCKDLARNFKLMEEVCRQYEKIKRNRKWLKGYEFLLNQLSHSTGTTEVPEGLRKILDENPKNFAEVRVWYRINS